jgi:hypothetical protein
MKKEQAKEFLPLIQAWADGKDLQIKFIGTGKWEDINPKAFLVFDKDPSEYRIKPLEFPVPPEGDEWHNPFNLTPEKFEVDKGYRPVTREEIEETNNKFPSDEFEYWSMTRCRWTGTNPNERFMLKTYSSTLGGTLRTKLPLLKRPQYEEMTVGEIEKLLGKKIKIVKEKENQ